jgi:hypothetical protein
LAIIPHRRLTTIPSGSLAIAKSLVASSSLSTWASRRRPVVLLWHLEQIGELVPQVGACGIVADGENNPICILQLTEVEIKPFNEVNAQFAYDYGEYGRTLAQWRVAS